MLYITTKNDCQEIMTETRLREYTSNIIDANKSELLEDISNNNLTRYDINLEPEQLSFVTIAKCFQFMEEKYVAVQKDKTVSFKLSFGNIEVKPYECSDETIAYINGILAEEVA